MRQYQPNRIGLRGAGNVNWASLNAAYSVSPNQLLPEYADRGPAAGGGGQHLPDGLPLGLRPATPPRPVPLGGSVTGKLTNNSTTITVTSTFPPTSGHTATQGAIVTGQPISDALGLIPSGTTVAGFSSGGGTITMSNPAAGASASDTIFYNSWPDYAPIPNSSIVLSACRLPTRAR